MKWSYKRVMDSWTSTQVKDNVKLVISLMGRDSNSIIFDLDDTERNMYFCTGKEAVIEDMGSKKKEIEEVFDFEKYNNLSGEELFKELQTKITGKQLNDESEEKALCQEGAIEALEPPKENIEEEKQNE